MKDFSYLIGIPYLKGGDDPAIGVDCYWVVKHVAKEAKGINLPEKPIGWRRYGRTIDWPTEIQPYDILFFSNNAIGMVDHVGIAVTQIEFIHAPELIGSVVQEPIERHKYHILAVGRFHDS